MSDDQQSPFVRLRPDDCPRVSVATITPGASMELIVPSPDPIRFGEPVTTFKYVWRDGRWVHYQDRVDRILISEPDTPKSP